MTDLRFGMEVYGIKEAVRELGRIDKTARRDLSKRYREIMAPTVRDAQSKVPPLPLSGFKRAWKTKSGFQMLPWQNDEAKKRIKAGIDTRMPRKRTVDVVNLTVFYVRWQGAVNTLFDLAKNGVFGANLSKKYGQASRIMWPTVTRHEKEITHDMAQLLEDVMDKVNRKLQ